MIPLEDEVETLNLYIELERLRFKNKFEFKMELDQGLDQEGMYVPPMLIQPFVENAIKHGVSKLIDGGDVELVAYVKDYFLTIQIRNSGRLVNGVVKKPKQGGYGLANTKQRLKLIYGGEASFKIYNENDKFVTTEVRIPQRF
jgi:LytS/YehU family sensor histidine kinase